MSKNYFTVYNNGMKFKFNSSGSGFKPSSSDNITPPKPTEDYNYLWFEALDDDCEVGINMDNKIVDLKYSFNKKTWTDFQVDSFNKAVMVPVPNGNKMYVKGNNPNGFNDGDIAYEQSVYNTFEFSANVKIGGDIASLLSYNLNIKEISSAYCFGKLFYERTDVVNIDNLICSVMGECCYHSMFSNCSSLISLPSGLLPATTLASNCYNSMFYNCSSLISLPSGLLPATTLASSCYSYMFFNCSSLTSLPSGLLPATTLASYCYLNMFSYCSNLNNITCLAQDISATGCLENWVYRVSSSGTFVKKSGVTWPSGVNGIPSGWTVQEI